MIHATPSVLTTEARAAIVQSLVQEHQAGVRAFIRALGVDQAWVDDVAQETFLIAYRKLDEWDRTRDAGPWLRGIARHLAMNERRKAARRSRLLDGGLAEVLIDHAEREPEAIATAAELLAALDSCLQELPQSGTGSAPRALCRRRDGRDPGRAVEDPIGRDASEAAPTSIAGQGVCGASDGRELGMTEARYHELLGRMLDSRISEADAEELRRGLETDPRGSATSANT